MDIETLEAVAELDHRVKAATSQFHSSTAACTTHDPTLGHVFGEMALTVSDVLLVAALSQVHVLVTGPTGRGKTDLVKLVCQGLFGNAWFLLRLNPHLTEETFADISMKKLSQEGLREAISPAPFLSLPTTVLDECNRTPSALTNILLGFTDGTIELKCGVKYDVGYAYRNSEGKDARYHFVIGTMNEGKGYEGTFALDSALSRRFTLRIPFAELRPTPHDLVNIIQQRTGHAEMESFSNQVGRIAAISDGVRRISLDPLAFVYLAYLGNVGRCPHAAAGFHFEDVTQQLCAASECRIQKRANGFCPSVGGLSEGVLIFLKRAAFGLAALRAARTYRAIHRACEQEDPTQTSKLQEFTEFEGDGDELRAAVLAKYVPSISVSVQDLKALLPFVGLGGKVWTAPEYVGKHFGGSTWQALQHYARETYASMETFFRQNQALFQQLPGGNGAIGKLKQRLEHAERFMDPVIRHTLQPFLESYQAQSRRPEEIAEENTSTKPIQDALSELVCP